MFTPDVEEIEVSIKELQKTVALADAFERLKANSDFQAVMDKAYFEEEAMRLTKLFGDPRPELSSEEILADIAAIGSVFRFFLRIAAMGDLARSEIDEHRQTQNEILAEEVDNT